jgi:phenylacetate-CoA ligase
VNAASGGASASPPKLPELPAPIPEPIELASRDEIAALQLERLRRTLTHAYAHVPYYRRAFDAAGVRPEDLRELADLRHFPFTSKQDLRDGYPYGMFAVPRDQVVRVHASSGTTGQATLVGYTRQDIADWTAMVARSLRASGVRPGDRVQVSYGYGLFTGGLGLHYGAEALGCAVIPASGGMTGRQVQLIRELRPDVICCTPSYLLAVADEMERQGMDPAGSSLRIGVLGAEPWSQAMRAEIEARMGLHAVDIYGLSEVMGPGVANECVETKDGPHIWEDFTYPEIIDPATGEVLPDGQSGELVFTTLTRQATPVIRYRTRDLTTLLPGTARAMRRMAKITGRDDDMMIVRGVNVFPTQIEQEILAVPELAPHFVCVLTRPERLDELTVRVETREPGTDHAVLASRLAARVKDHCGVTVRVELVEPGGLPRSSGKANRVLDLREL